jgi:hypothetical protein
MISIQINTGRDRNLIRRIFFLTEKIVFEFFVLFYFRPIQVFVSSVEFLLQEFVEWRPRKIDCERSEATIRFLKNVRNDHKIYQKTTKYTKWPQNIPNGIILQCQSVVK